ncbi:MAG TPA: deaminase domain-containing protein, partial [Flavilitoribacter sp.]|nr:deaminase domain-containing protein [Flavilitoribacter sp.]
QTTVYPLTLTNDEGDILKALQYTVTVQDIGVEIYPASPTVCSGSEQTLEATTWGDRTNYAYAWSNGSTTPTTQVSQGGIYSITVTDTQTGCQEETSAEVAEVSLDASIQPDSEPVCAGQPLALTAAATGTQNELTFEWSTGETGDLISVTQSGPYTVTITDETTGCEGIAEYVLETENPSLQISPESLVICPGGQAELSADPGYQQYEWQFENANGEFTTLPPGADPAVANVNLPGRYRVLATDANGCTVTAEITVGDANSPDAVKAFFVKRGFYCIPINIPEPPGVHSSDPTSGPRSLTGPCEDNDCSNAFCVKDFADLPVEIEGAAAEDLEPLAEAYLAYFHNQFGYSEGKAYITANDQLCACPEFMEIVDNNFNASGLRFWIHLFEAGEGGQDCLFIRANVPGDDNHYPESEARVAFLDGILDYAREHPVGGVMTMAGQILFNAMDGLLDNYADLYTPGASYRETGGSEAVCSSTEGDGLVIMTPAGKPLILPENSTARFGASALRQDDVPDGALSGFTEILSGNQARYYYARLDDQHFWGYQQAGLSGNFLEPNPGNYLPQTLPFQPGTADPKVNLGYKFQNQEGSNYYRLEEHLFTCPLPDEIDDGSGPLADPLPCIGAKTNTNQYDIDLPPVTEANFIAPNKRYIAEWAGGTLVQVPNEQGGYSQIYAQENDGEFIFYIWNCTGEWEPYTPDNIHVLNAVVAAFYGAKYGDEGDYAGDDVTRQFCFDIHPSQLEGVFDRANSEDFGPGNQVDNYARLDAADKAAIESAAQTALSRYGLKIKYIVTRDAVSGLDNTPVNAASLGNNALDDPDNLNDYDLLAWVHLTSDGGGQACFRLTENFYLFDEGPQLEGVEGLNEKLEIRSVMADALKEGGGKHPDQLKDQDPDDQYEDPESPAGAGNENPWRFGIRPDVSEPLNFFTIFKEVGGLGRATIRETEIPGILYLSQGESMFQAPAALCGAGNAIIGNNPFVGIAQGVSFAVSAVKDEEVRRGIGHAITHPVETAQGMYKAKVEAYESPDRTVFYYTLGNDGVTILQALFTGGAGLTKFLKTLKTDARESVEALKKHLDDLGPGSPLHEKVADFTELEGEAFANFLGEVGKDHVKKFVNNPDLARVWKKLQNEAGDLDLANTFKKLPDSHPGFYEKLFETITDGQGNALENAADFFGDLKNNGPLMDAFLEAPGRVKAWKVLDDAGVDIALRRNVDNLKHIDGFENLKPGSLDNIKNELSSLPVDRQEHFLAGLGNVSNNDALGASLTLNRIPEVSEIRAATDKIFQHRVDNGVQWPNKNFGYMEGNLSGGNVQTIPDNIVSSGPAVPVNEQVFDAIEVGGWERFTDSEYKMLNQLARDLGAIPGVPIANQVNPNISGTIKIVSERAYCASCQGVIQKFNELFPGVEVTLIDGVRKID